MLPWQMMDTQNFLCGVNNGGEAKVKLSAIRPPLGTISSLSTFILLAYPRHELSLPVTYCSAEIGHPLAAARQTPWLLTTF